MANIGTINVRFYALAGKRFDDRFDEADVLKLLLDNSFSYCVPIYMDYGTFCWYFDVQYGARWASAHTVENVIEKYGHLFDRTWIRYSNDGGDEDGIFCWYEETFDERICRYGIDLIKIYSQDSI